MRILAVSDQVEDALYTPSVRERLGKIDLILGCGDLPYYYWNTWKTMLTAPLCYVHGNHDPLVEYNSERGTKTAPEGGNNSDLHCVTRAAAGRRAGRLHPLQAGWELSVHAE